MKTWVKIFQKQKRDFGQYLMNVTINFTYGPYNQTLLTQDYTPEKVLTEEDLLRFKA